MESAAELEHAVVARCRAQGWKLAAAESCSGGLIAHRITNVSGASEVFLGGLVAYANTVKIERLGVPAEVIAELGAVSEEVALAMAQGARRLFGADVGVGVTGIAGPGGGSADKPVGLVFIAVAGPGGAEVRRFLFKGDRTSVKSQTAEAALKMIMETRDA